MEVHKDSKVLPDSTIRRVTVILERAVSTDSIYNGIVTLFDYSN